MKCDIARLFTLFNTQLLFFFSVPPDILDYPTSTDMVAREGSNVTLRCAAKGTPQPTITWKRESGDYIHLNHGEKGTIVYSIKRFLIICLPFSCYS